MPRKKVTPPGGAVSRGLQTKLDAPPLAGFVSDPHVGLHARHGGPTVDGLNRRARETIEVLRRAVAATVDRGAEVFVVCGDLFQTARPEPAVIRAVQDVFAAAREHLQVVLIPGNHDMPDASCEAGNTAMAPLWEVATIMNSPGTLMDAPDFRLLCVPFDGRLPMAEHLAAVLKDQKATKPSVLATHVGVWDAKSAAPWMKKARDGIDAGVLLALMEKAGISIAFVGNYHEHRVWTDVEGGTARTIVQVGTLCPASHSDGGLVDRGLVAFLEADGSWSKQEIPGPRFVTIDESYVGKGPPPSAPKDFSYYVRSKIGGPMSDRDEDPCDVYGYVAFEDVSAKEVDGDPEPVLREESDEEAIAAHVSEMDLAPTVERDAVRDLALACWKRA
jgi:hypothetical protein